MKFEIPPGDELTAALREKLGLGGDAKDGGARGKRLPQLPELDGAVVNVELLRYPRGGAAADWTRDRNSWAARAISAWISRSSFASIICRTNFLTLFWRRRSGGLSR